MYHIVSAIVSCRTLGHTKGHKNGVYGVGINSINEVAPIGQLPKVRPQNGLCIVNVNINIVN